MTFSTVLDTAQIEQTRKQIESHTAIILGFITTDNTAFNAIQRTMERSKPASDPDVSVAGIKAYVTDRMGATITSELRDRSLTHSFLSTALDLVDWYAVLSYLAELENDLDKHPF